MSAVVVAVLASGCQGEYPLEPTLCDQWCEATHGFSCDFYDPAACVAECEERGYTHDESCQQPFFEALACVRKVTDWECFSASLAQPCQVEIQALYECAEF